MKTSNYGLFLVAMAIYFHACVGMNRYAPTPPDNSSAIRDVASAVRALRLECRCDK